MSTVPPRVISRIGGVIIELGLSDGVYYICSTHSKMDLPTEAEAWGRRYARKYGMPYIRNVRAGDTVTDLMTRLLLGD
jgi:hypothetical protein